MIKITQITKLLKPGFVAQDRNGDICWYSEKPYIEGTIWMSRGAVESFKDFQCLQDIEPWTDDWKSSLLKVGDNE